jgi:hypothetical protein
MAGQKKIFDEKVKFIQQITDELDKKFGTLGEQLAKTIISEFVDSLDTEDGNILNTSKNLKLIATIDKIYNTFMQDHGSAIPQQILTGVEQLSNYNVQYFKDFSRGKAQYAATTKQVQKVIADRLGIGDKTQLKEGGYMDNLLKDNKVRSDIKKMSLREVMKGSGFKDFKQGLQQFIVGDEEKLGAFKQYYRNYAYDVYVQVDRDESMLMATDLVLQCFFYEGTIIDTSRPFCKERAGKLFTVEEAQAWESDPWIQNALKKGFITSYNPVADMGLWACRHVPRFVSNEVAAALRPELKAALGVKDSEIATPEQVQEHTVDMEALMKEDDSFDTYLNQKDNRKTARRKAKRFSGDVCRTNCSSPHLRRQRLLVTQSLAA